jgi:predicted membrane protein
MFFVFSVFFFVFFFLSFAFGYFLVNHFNITSSKKKKQKKKKRGGEPRDHKGCKPKGAENYKELCKQGP